MWAPAIISGDIWSPRMRSLLVFVYVSLSSTSKVPPVAKKRNVATRRSSELISCIRRVTSFLIKDVENEHRPF